MRAVVGAAGGEHTLGHIRTHQTGQQSLCALALASDWRPLDAAAAVAAKQSERPNENLFITARVS